MSRIAGHPVAEAEIENRGKDVSRNHDRRTGPDRILDRIVHRFEEVGHADDRNECRVHEQADEIVDDAGYHKRQGLGQYDETHHARIVQSQRQRGFVLSLAQRLKTASHFFRHIGGRKHDDARQWAQEAIWRPCCGQEQRQQIVGHEQDRDERHAAHELDEYDARHSDDGKRRPAAKRKQHAERQREDDPDHSRDQRNENASPKQRIDERQTKQG